MTNLGFRTDDVFMAWERPQLIFSPPPFSIHFKVLGIFEEKLRASVKAILTGEYDTGDMEQIVKDMLYAKLLVKRWLYVGLPGEERENMIRVQQNVLLRKIVKQLCLVTPGFTGTRKKKGD